MKRIFCALATLVSCLASPPVDASPPAMARHQIFFVGHDPQPVVVALILQISRDERRNQAEAKAFLGWHGKWQTPFWERVELPAWPGDDLDAMANAWQRARTGKELKVTWNGDGRAFELGLRRKSGALVVSASALAPCGGGDDPHGQVAWRASRGALRVNGREVRGVVLVDSLGPGAVAWPRFGVFEMWLVAGRDGSLTLARVDLVRRKVGALRVSSDGSGRTASFAVTPRRVRSDSETRFMLPDQWDAEVDRTHVLTRRDGEIGRGRRPDGAPALYDIGLASSEDGSTQALVFHVQDEAQVPPRKGTKARRR